MKKINIRRQNEHFNILRLINYINVNKIYLTIVTEKWLNKRI